MADEETQKRDQEDEDSATDGQSNGDDDGDSRKEKVQALEDDPPKDLSDWPDDEAKYETFGGPEGEHSYDEGPEKNLGPSSLRHQEGGGVTIEGEEVDNPEDYKGKPVKGGPTDPDTSGTEAGREDDPEDPDGDDEEDDDQDDDEDDRD